MAEASYQQTNFLGGEWSPFFQGRADHPKYRTAMNVCRNGLPLEEGTWVRRPGSRLKAPTYQNKPGRIYSVEFTTSQPYDVEFTDGWMRFFSGHKLVYTTDGPQTVTAISTANPAVITLSAAVTWATDDEIYFTFDAAHSSGALPLRQRSFLLTKLTTTTFSLRDGLTLGSVDGSTLAVPAGATITASRVLRVASPYVNGSWAKNRIVQNQDMGVVLNGAYSPYRLTIAPGAIAGTATAALDKITFKDGPYLDAVTDTAGTSSVLNWTGGTYSGPPVFNPANPVAKGKVAAIDFNDGYAATMWTYWVYTATLPAFLGGGPMAATQNAFTPVLNGGAHTGYDSEGWAPVDPNGVGAHVTGTITVTAGFQQWISTINYDVGNYVNVSTNSFKAIAPSIGVQPGVTGGWATYWVAVDSGIAVTGDGNTPVGFQSTDVGRLIRIWSAPPEWDPAIIYPDGAMVTYQGSAYAMTGATEARPSRAGINPATTFTAPQWGRNLADQFDSSQTGTPDLYGTTATLQPGWAPVGQAGQWSWGRIATVTNSSTATVTIDTDSAPLISPLGNPPLTIFRMGLWSDTTTYPACGSFYEGRFWFGGAVPNRFDTSQSQGWEKGSDVVQMAPTAVSGDQVTGFISDGTVTDACGISYTFESRDTNEIFWFEPDHNGIMAGTFGGEWLIQASTLSDPITPTSMQAKRVTKYGCANIEPKRTGISLVFVQKFRHRVMEFLADVFTGRYVAPHLNETAKHLTKSGVSEIGYQEELAPILWCRAGDLTTHNQISVDTSLSTHTPCTWNPGDDVLMALSNSNYTATGPVGTSTGGPQGGVRTTLGRNNGQFYFETYLGTPWLGYDVGVGIATGLADLSTVGTSAVAAIAIFASGHVWVNGAYRFLGPGPIAGFNLGFAVDLNLGRLWITWDGIAWNGTTNLTSEDPVAGVGGFDIRTIAGVNGALIYPMFCGGGRFANAATVTGNWGASAFTYTPPTGYHGWDFVPGGTGIVTIGVDTPAAGKLIGATYRRVSAFTTEAPAFVGWHRHDLGHNRLLTSMAVGPSGDNAGLLDNLDMVTTDGQNYYVEGLTQIFDEDDNLSDAWFVDGGVVPDSAYVDTLGGLTPTWNGTVAYNVGDYVLDTGILYQAIDISLNIEPGVTTGWQTHWVVVANVSGIRFTGLNYLIGAGAVSIVAFGLDLGDFTVDAYGTIFVPYGSGIAPTSFDYTAAGAGAYLFTSAYVTANLLTTPGRNGAVPFSTGYIPCIVGYTFTSQGQILRPATPEQSGSRSGPPFSKKSRSHQFGGLFHNTTGIQVGTDFANLILPANFKDDGDDFFTPDAPYSGIWRDTVLNDYGYGSMLCWQVLRPYPASVVSIGAFLKTQDA